MANNSRQKIIPDKIFYKLWKMSTSGCTKKEYLNYFLNVTSNGYINFKKKYNIQFEEAAEMLNNIYDAATMPFNILLEKTGKKKCEIRDIFCIPQRTFEDWCSGKNKVNQTIKLMILRQFHLIHLGKYIKVQSEIEYEKSTPKVYKKHTDKNNKVVKEDDKHEVSKKVSNWTPKQNEVDSPSKYESMSDEEFDKLLDDISIQRKERTEEKKRIEDAANISRILRETDYLNDIMKNH